MRTKLLFVLILAGFVFFASCDSSSAEKYLEFKTDMLLPQAAIGQTYDLTFTVTYGEDKWDADTGFAESEIVWGFDDWTLNGSSETTGPANITFADGKISGTPDASDIGLWSFKVTIQKGKKIVFETYYLPITRNIEISTPSILPLATTDLPYSAYFDASFGAKPYYWLYENWAKDGTPVNNPPSGLTCYGVGFIEGTIDNSEAGKWTFDVKVYDTSIPHQKVTTKTFELEIKLKISVPTNYSTIQAAVDFAKDGDIVYLEAGTFQGPGNRDVNFNGKTLTILGDPQAPGTVIIDCQGTSADPHRAFYFASGEKNCLFDGFTIINGSAPQEGSYYYGGAIYMSTEIELTIQNVNFKDIITNVTATSTMYVYGGMIYAGTLCDLTLKNVNAENIEATVQYASSAAYVDGQLIFTDDDTVLKIEDCTFDGGYGEAGSYRGLLYIDYSTCEMKNVVFKNFESSTYYYLVNYGLFYLYYSECTWENVKVVDNRVGTGKTNNASYSYGQAYGYGYWYYSDVVLKNCVFANNIFGTDDPSDSYFIMYGIYLYHGTSKWIDCVFACNVTDTTVPDFRPYGFLMRIYYNVAEFHRCHFVNNRAPSTYVYTSYSYGGLIQVYYGDAVFNDCVFAYNEVGVGCGAIQATYSMTCTVNNSTFYKNTGYRGGAIFYYYATTINNCVIWDNTATDTGNEIYGYSTSYQLSLNNTLYSNQSGDVQGGSINPVSCVNTDPYFKDTGDNPVTGDCTFSADTMTVTGTPGTSAFLSEIKRGDGIFLTSDGEAYALFVLEVVSDTELKVAGYYKGTPGTGSATVKKLDFTPQHTSNGDANDSPCVDSGDDGKVSSATDIAGNTRIVDGNGDSTAKVDMGAYELQ